MTKTFYISRTNSYYDQNRFGTTLHIGPAYQKLMHVCRALRSTRHHVEIVTVPVNGKLPLSSSDINWRVFFERGIKFTSLGMVGGRLLNRIFASMAFLAFCLKHHDRGGFVFYNFFPEYIPAAIALKLMGNPGILDIEDAPRADEYSPAGIASRLSFKILAPLCKSRSITISHRVEHDLGLKDPLVIYGASPVISQIESNFNKSLSAQEQELIIVYGGKLLIETVIDIFTAAMRILAKSSLSSGRKISVFVTGFGGESEMSQLLSDLPVVSNLSVLWKKDLDFDEYSKLIRSAHVGLCLKVPGTPMADTTFPSKVVELLRSKLLLISTPVSDVPMLFADSDAVILGVPYEDSLADSIMDIANHPDRYYEIASSGILKSNALFSYPAVGERMKTFLSELRT